MRWMGLMALGLALALGDAGGALHEAQAKAKPQVTVKKQSLSVRKAKAKPGPRTRKAVSVKARPAVFVPAKPSFGQLYGLNRTDDPLDLKSSVALVMDQDTEEVLLAKNDNAVLPIASITKLMTALIVTEARQPLDELITITQEEVDTEKGTRSRLRVGTQLSRGELLHLALMSSENRAAHALGRSYPGGLDAAVRAMNAKAQLLGMHDTEYAEPTGLSPRNQSSAHDLARLVKTAYAVPLIRELSTSTGTTVRVGRRETQFGNTNGWCEPDLGHRPAENRLHLRGRSLPGDAGATGRPQADHGVSGLGRQVQPHRRRRARAPLASCFRAGGQDDQRRAHALSPSAAEISAAGV
jgi:D-alanyl-D-alanine endopeptidase (penicillin-binding protein 7)